VARYLAKLTERLGCASPGTIVKGGGEGLRESTGRRRNSALVALRRLGERYASTGNLDTDLLRQVAGFERMPTVVLCVFRVLGWLGLGDVMWRGRMRENGCYAQRKARPYV